MGSQEPGMREKTRSVLMSGAVAGLVVATGMVQAAQQGSVLVLSGYHGTVPVTQMNGKNYVSVEALARATNGSMSFNGNQIVLTLPGAGGGGGAVSQQAMQQTAQPQPAPQNIGFSKQFLTAAIEEMSTLREWHSALATAIANGFPVTAELVAPYQAQSVTNLRLMQVAVSTQSDQSAAQLISNAFQKMKQLSDKYVAKRANLDFVSPDALKNDSLNQGLIACGKSLGAMAANGQFVDDGTCN
jgi:hypothetical protein